MNDDIISDPEQAMKDSLNFMRKGENTVTKEAIMDKINKVSYTVLDDNKTTICSIQMKNGYSVIGVSSCVDPVNYNKSLGEMYSFEDAFNKIWPLEGYLLAEKIYKNI